MVEGGTFVIEGDREWGDEKQVYKWVFSHNPTSDLYECEYTVTGMEKTIRFEVSVTDLATTLKSPFGEPGGEINITNTIVGKTLEGVVSVTSGSDINVLKGTIIHEKSKD